MNNGKICVSVCAEHGRDFIESVTRAAEYADVMELRMDCLRQDHVRRVVERLPGTKKTYLFTMRSLEQGGKCELAIGDKLKFWEHVFYTCKSDFMIDVEGTNYSLLCAINPEKVRRIVSSHDFGGTGSDLTTTWQLLSSTPGDLIKIAVHAEDAVDSIAIWKLLQLAAAEMRPTIPIAMGEAGKWTRILGLAHGAFMTYASLEPGSETAPGQITAQDMIEIYRVKDLDQDTKVFGVIGDPVSQSLSTYMHNPAFAESGVNAVFIPFLVKDIDAFMRRMVRPETREVELNFGGFSVTMPHKQSIMKYLDAIDPVAEKIGAVNTVKIENGRMTGYNTDAHGFITPLKNKFGALNGVRAGVFGAGGAARAVVYALKQENADVTVCARDPKKAARLATEFGVRFSNISNLTVAGFRNTRPPSGRESEISNRSTDYFDIIVDATPLGMKGPHESESLFAADELEGVRFVYDLVTSANDTPIVREAKKAGVTAIGGVEMLVAQGARQFKIWTGREAPLELMKSCVQKRFESRL